MFWKSDLELYEPFLRPRIRKGKGVREGSEYVSWIEVGEFPNVGNSRRVFGIRIPRTFHLHSDPEATHFFKLERDRSVVDVKENWPIFDIPRTLELCAERNLQHKYRGHFPDPVTINFLVTRVLEDAAKRQHRADSIKTPEDAKKPEVLERHEVERVWCSECADRRHLDLVSVLVDTSGYDLELPDLLFLRVWFEHGYVPNSDIEMRFMERFSSVYKRNVLLGDLLDECARSLRFPVGQVQNIFRYCAWADMIHVPLRQGLALNRPLVI